MPACAPAAQIIFPEYSCQGFHPTKWRDFTTTLDGPEVAIFKEACKRNKVGSRMRAASSDRGSRLRATGSGMGSRRAGLVIWVADAAAAAAICTCVSQDWL
jgi:hypothetical protein